MILQVLCVFGIADAINCFATGITFVVTCVPGMLVYHKFLLVLLDPLSASGIAVLGDKKVLLQNAAMRSNIISDNCNGISMQSNPIIVSDAVLANPLECVWILCSVMVCVGHHTHTLGPNSSSSL
mgnify:CR=1 FL=1